MPCIKPVDKNSCQYCQNPTVKFGKTGIKQKYRCTSYKRTQLSTDQKNAYYPDTSADIASHVIEGCSIRSIARLLRICANTVLSHILHIARQAKRPIIRADRKYDVKRLCAKFK